MPNSADFFAGVSDGCGEKTRLGCLFSGQLTQTRGLVFSGPDLAPAPLNLCGRGMSIHHIMPNISVHLLGHHAAHSCIYSIHHTAKQALHRRIIHQFQDGSCSGAYGNAKPLAKLTNAILCPLNPMEQQSLTPSTLFVNPVQQPAYSTTPSP